MTDQSSELVEISKLNGSFRRNYGKLIGAFLYLRSIRAVRGRERVCTCDHRICRLAASTILAFADVTFLSAC